MPANQQTCAYTLTASDLITNLHNQAMAALLHTTYAIPCHQAIQVDGAEGHTFGTMGLYRKDQGEELFLVFRLGI